MPKFYFKSDDLKAGLVLAKLVKPESKGDFCFKFFPNSLVIFSYDKRRYVTASVSCTSEVDDDFESDEFYLLPDRVELFNTDLENIVATLNEKSLSIKVYNDNQSRQANLKRRATQSRRPSVPKFSDSEFVTLNRKVFEELLHQVSCSALVKETKTEEDMRVNQIHFYSNQDCVFSSTRYYGSVAYFNGIKLDASIVSSDIPTIRGFLNKIKSDEIRICQNSKSFSIIDPNTNSILSVGKVSTKKPNFEVLDEQGFRTRLQIELKSFLKSLEWSTLAIEGTQRLGFQAKQNTVKFFNAKEELSEIPVEFKLGNQLCADFPVKYLHMMIKHLNTDVILCYDHVKSPNILGITQVSDENQLVNFMHFLPSMRNR